MSIVDYTSRSLCLMPIVATQQPNAFWHKRVDEYAPVINCRKNWFSETWDTNGNDLVIVFWWTDASSVPGLRDIQKTPGETSPTIHRREWWTWS